MNHSRFKTILMGPLAMIFNLLMVFVCFSFCRILFLWVNYSYYPDLTFAHFVEMFKGGLLFDTSAIFYTNILYMVLMLFPFHLKENPAYQRVLKWLFVVSNMIIICMNLIDTVYFQYSGRRTTASVFGQFANEDNLIGIFGIEMIKHWYLVLIAALLAYGLFKLYRTPKVQPHGQLAAYYIIYTLALLICTPLTIFGMRGGIGRDVRPITISNANQYVNRPAETAIVLNTPFSIYRTFGKKPFVVPNYFSGVAEMEAVFTPVHYPNDSVPFRDKNVEIGRAHV